MYRLRHADPDFAADWDSAVEDALDALEEEVRRRAIEGVEKPVHYQGQRVDSVTQYSDQLAMFLLRGRRPQIFREGETKLSEPQSNGGNAKEALSKKLENLARAAKTDKADD